MPLANQLLAAPVRTREREGQAHEDVPLEAVAPKVQVDEPLARQQLAARRPVVHALHCPRQVAGRAQRQVTALPLGVVSDHPIARARRRCGRQQQGDERGSQHRWPGSTSRLPAGHHSRPDVQVPGGTRGACSIGVLRLCTRGLGASKRP